MITKKDLWFAFVLIVLAASAAAATFHFMQIEQVIGGVQGDTTCPSSKFLWAGSSALRGSQKHPLYSDR